MHKHDYQRNGCRNCQTKRHKKRRAGYCSRCYSKVRKAGRLQRDVARASEGKSNAKAFQLKQSVWRTEKELEVLRSLEQPFVREYADPLAIEGLFYALTNATRSTPDAARYHNIAGQMFNRFHPDKYGDFYLLLYELLLDIVETLPSRKYRRKFSTLWTWQNHLAEWSDYDEFKEWERQQSASIVHETRSGLRADGS